MIVEAVVLGIALAAILLVLIYTLLTGAPPTPTGRRVRAAVLDSLPETLSGTVFELGAGWGGLATVLARRYPDTAVTAVELSPLPWLVLKSRRALFGPDNLMVRRADFHRVSLSGASLVVCYLGPEGTERLRPKLEAELSPGTLVLTHTFAIRDWFPVIETHAEDLYKTPVYVYRIGDV